MLSTCVSPRWNRPVPCAVGMTPTSAESGRRSRDAATVDAEAVFDDAAAHDLLGERADGGLELLLGGGLASANCGQQLGEQLGSRASPSAGGRSVLSAICWVVGEPGAAGGLDRGVDRRRV